MFDIKGDKFSYKNFFKSAKSVHKTEILCKPFSNLLTNKESSLNSTKDNFILSRK